MMRSAAFWIATIVALAAAQGAAAGGGDDELRCGRAARPRYVAGPSQYAPDRKADILHVKLEVVPDFKARTIAATATIRFAPISEPLRELRLDAVDLAVSAVESSAKLAGWNATGQEIVATFAEPIPPGSEQSVKIVYTAEPKRGLYFRTPEMGYKPEDEHLWTQGEPDEARHWFPGADYPNEKFTSEIVCRVPDDMIVLSNGRMVSEELEAASRTKTVRWIQEKPHPNYLIALAAGKFRKIEGRHGDVPLRFYTPASQIENAANSFRETDEIMGFFEREIGLPFPWAKYDQVVVDDFTAGGMENTSITILTDRTLHGEASESLRSSRNLVAHEMAHQWFGDYVTCKDWGNLWLNEGFATFYAHLYEEAKEGRDAALYGFRADAAQVSGDPDGMIPIVTRGYTNPMQQFSARAYQKGSWVLRMLRQELGEEIYRRAIKAHLERRALGSATTEDLRAAFEEASGRTLERFFDQWVYRGGIPSLSVDYEWDGAAKTAKISVKQTQEINDKAPAFEFDAKARFRTKAGDVERVFPVKSREESFYVALPEEPTIVRFDPDYALLANVSFSPPEPMLRAQLEDAADMIGRILAIEGLKAKGGKAAVEAIAKALRADPFYGVRIEASKALREIHSAEAGEALLASLDQPDARARAQAMRDLRGFYGPATLEALAGAIRQEKIPEVQAAAIKSLGLYRGADPDAILRERLASHSYRNALASAAIDAIRDLDDPAYADALRDALGGREAEFTSFGISDGLDALAYIARFKDKRDAEREFIAGYAASKKLVVQAGALRALGTLGDPKAIPLVETFDTPGPEGDPIREAARKALEELRKAKPAAIELGDLRDEVAAVKKENEKLRKDLEDLKKRLDAKPAEDKGDAKPASHD